MASKQNTVSPFKKKELLQKQSFKYICIWIKYKVYTHTKPGLYHLMKYKVQPNYWGQCEIINLK